VRIARRRSVGRRGIVAKAANAILKTPFRTRAYPVDSCYPTGTPKDTPPFGVRWHDTAFLCSGRYPMVSHTSFRTHPPRAVATASPQSGVMPPHSKKHAHFQHTCLPRRFRLYRRDSH